uniref:Uncharacterized protein n=1 Tax=Astyanax mexicanus TaxID=7994 RepID=A0A8B9LDD1_ASTMX
MDEVEKYMMLHLYEQAFCPESADDEVKDLDIQKRIRALHWVTVQMLGAPLNEEIPAVSDSVIKAITALTESVFQLLITISITTECMIGSPVSIVSFKLKGLCYILHSYCIINSTMKCSRKTSSNFVCLFQCCAVAFIEKLDAQSLSLSPEDFERYMSGQASPTRSQEPSSSQRSHRVELASGGSAPVAKTYHQLDLLTDLETRQERVIEGAHRMENDLIEWKDGMERSVQDVLEGLQLETKPTATSAIDSDNVDSEGLPPPLQPQVFAG